MKELNILQVNSNLWRSFELSMITSRNKSSIFK